MKMNYCFYLPNGVAVVVVVVILAFVDSITTKNFIKVK
jgi:hypothetical protein